MKRSQDDGLLQIEDPKIRSIFEKYVSKSDYKEHVDLADCGRDFLVSGLSRQLRFPTLSNVSLDFLLFRERPELSREQVYRGIIGAGAKYDDIDEIFDMLTHSSHLRFQNVFGTVKYLTLVRNPISGYYTPMHERL